MSNQDVVFALVTFLHDLFTAVWIGGLLTLTLSVLPSARSVLGAGPQVKALMNAIQGRLSRLVYFSIVGLIVTGLLQARQNDDFAGLFSTANDYTLVLTLKHVLVLVMIAITLIRSLGLKGWKLAAPAKEQLSIRLLFANAALGVGVLLLSGFSAALAA
ncbi:MAG: CopD family protein [Anaerolineae bacterium]|nr:CopD family protein [Anaerolineae bacterium]